jgi:hypothetical protein
MNIWDIGGIAGYRCSFSRMVHPAQMRSVSALAWVIASVGMPGEVSLLDELRLCLESIGVLGSVLFSTAFLFSGFNIRIIVPSFRLRDSIAGYPLGSLRLPYDVS